MPLSILASQARPRRVESSASPEPFGEKFSSKLSRQRTPSPRHDPRTGSLENLTSKLCLLEATEARRERRVTERKWDCMSMHGHILV